MPASFVTGADSKFVDSAARWVAVPEVLLGDPVFSRLGPFTDSSNTKRAADGSSSTQMVLAETASASASSGSANASSSSSAIKTEQGDLIFFQCSPILVRM